MKYDISAKPTKYKNRLYRSRLEARWAAFFDLLEWKYEYEPIDFKYWSPDFLIHGYNGNKLYLEIKPVYTLALYYEYQKKISKSGLLKNRKVGEISKETYYLCSEIVEYDNHILFGYEICDDVFPDKIYFKYPLDLSSLLQNWVGLINGNEKDRKNFIVYTNTEFYEVLNYWIDSANEVMFLKPHNNY